MGFLTDKHFEKDGLPFLVVIGPQGQFVGMLEAKSVLSALLEGVQEGPNAEQSLLQSAPVNLSKTVGHIMNRNIPVLPPDALLDEAFTCIQKFNTEAIAVIDEGRVVGLISARILFEQASTLTVGALTGGVIPPAHD
jgi:predicted transcriptional regulator